MRSDPEEISSSELWNQDLFQNLSLKPDDVPTPQEDQSTQEVQRSLSNEQTRDDLSDAESAKRNQNGGTLNGAKRNDSTYGVQSSVSVGHANVDRSDVESEEQKRDERTNDQRSLSIKHTKVNNVDAEPLKRYKKEAPLPSVKSGISASGDQSSLSDDRESNERNPSETSDIATNGDCSSGQLDVGKSGKESVMMPKNKTNCTIQEVNADEDEADSDQEFISLIDQAMGESMTSSGGGDPPNANECSDQAAAGDPIIASPDPEIIGADAVEDDEISEIQQVDPLAIDDIAPTAEEVHTLDSDVEEEISILSVKGPKASRTSRLQQQNPTINKDQQQQQQQQQQQRPTVDTTTNTKENDRTEKQNTLSNSTVRTSNFLMPTTGVAQQHQANQVLAKGTTNQTIGTNRSTNQSTLSNPVTGQSNPTNPAIGTSNFRNATIGTTNLTNTTQIITKHINTTTGATNPAAKIPDRATSTTTIANATTNSINPATRTINLTNSSIGAINPINPTIRTSNSNNSSVVKTNPTIRTPNPSYSFFVATNSTNPTLRSVNPLHSSVGATNPLNLAIPTTNPINLAIPTTNPINSSIRATNPTSTHVGTTHASNVIGAVLTRSGDSNALSRATIVKSALVPSGSFRPSFQPTSQPGPLVLSSANPATSDPLVVSAAPPGNGDAPGNGAPPGNGSTSPPISAPGPVIYQQDPKTRKVHVVLPPGSKPLPPPPPKKTAVPEKGPTVRHQQVQTDPMPTTTATTAAATTKRDATKSSAAPLPAGVIDCIDLDEAPQDPDVILRNVHYWKAQAVKMVSSIRKRKAGGNPEGYGSSVESTKRPNSGNPDGGGPLVESNKRPNLSSPDGDGSLAPSNKRPSLGNPGRDGSLAPSIKRPNFGGNPQEAVVQSKQAHFGNLGGDSVTQRNKSESLGNPYESVNQRNKRARLGNPYDSVHLGNSDQLQIPMNKESRPDIQTTNNSSHHSDVKRHIQSSLVATLGTTATAAIATTTTVRRETDAPRNAKHSTSKSSTAVPLAQLSHTNTKKTALAAIKKEITSETTDDPQLDAVSNNTSAQKTQLNSQFPTTSNNTSDVERSTVANASMSNRNTVASRPPFSRTKAAIKTEYATEDRLLSDGSRDRDDSTSSNVSREIPERHAVGSVNLKAPDAQSQLDRLRLRFCWVEVNKIHLPPGQTRVMIRETLPRVKLERDDNDGIGDGDPMDLIQGMSSKLVIKTERGHGVDDARSISGSATNGVQKVKAQITPLGVIWKVVHSSKNRTSNAKATARATSANAKHDNSSPTDDIKDAMRSPALANNTISRPNVRTMSPTNANLLKSSSTSTNPERLPALPKESISSETKNTSRDENTSESSNPSGSNNQYASINQSRSSKQSGSSNQSGSNSQTGLKNSSVSNKHNEHNSKSGSSDSSKSASNKTSADITSKPQTDQIVYAGCRCPRPGCDFASLTIKALNTHVRMDHDSEGLFICIRCPFKTALEPYLMKHVAAIHPDDIPELMKGSIAKVREKKSAVQANGNGAASGVRDEGTSEDHTKVVFEGSIKGKAGVILVSNVKTRYGKARQSDDTASGDKERSPTNINLDSLTKNVAENMSSDSIRIASGSDPAYGSKPKVNLKSSDATKPNLPIAPTEVINAQESLNLIGKSRKEGKRKQSHEQEPSLTKTKMLRDHNQNNSSASKDIVIVNSGSNGNFKDGNDHLVTKPELARTRLVSSAFTDLKQNGSVDCVNGNSGINSTFKGSNDLIMTKPEATRTKLVNSAFTDVSSDRTVISHHEFTLNKILPARSSFLSLQRGFTCDLCPVMAPTKEEMDDHVRKAHPGAPVKKEIIR